MTLIHCTRALGRMKGRVSADTRLSLAERAATVRAIEARIAAARRREEILALAGEARDGLMVVALAALAVVVAGVGIAAAALWIGGAA